MKKSIKFITATLICGSVFFACQKEFSKDAKESPQPKTLTSVSSYDLISDPSTGAAVNVSVGIESTTGVPEVTRTSTTPGGSEAAAIYSYGGSLLNSSTHQIDIPDNGNVFWFVPANSNGTPQIMTGGESYSISCVCDGTSGSCAIDWDPNGDNCGTCVAADCDGLCQTIKSEAVTTGHDIDGAGVIVMGQIITVDGIDYVAKSLASNSSTSVYVKPISGGSNSTELSISRNSNGQTVTITTSSSSSSPEASFFIYDVGVASNFGGTVTIPNNGEKYWLVPLTGGGTPSIMSGGSNLIFTCTCSDIEGGTCTPATDDVCNPYCESGTCATCEESWSQGVIIRANSIVYNGSTYN